MTKTVVITGAMGFVGSHTAKVFKANGYRVIGIDREETIRGAGQYLDAWLKDDFVNVLAIAAKDNSPIIHCAGTSLVGPSILNPAEYYENNSAKTNRALESLANSDWQGTFVFSSSAATYGYPDDGMALIKETDPQLPISPYGWSKLFCEKIIKDHAYARGFKGIALRYFNACGCDPDGTLGHNVDDTHLIPRILSAHQNGKPFIMYGNDYATPDGTCIRDYLHVMDIAQAHLAAVELGETMNAGEFGAYNLGTGYGISNGVVVESCSTIVGEPINVSYGPRRIGDPDALIASSQLFRDKTGWFAKSSDIGTIVKTAWNWQKNLPLFVDSTT